MAVSGDGRRTQVHCNYSLGSALYILIMDVILITYKKFNLRDSNT